MTLSKYPCAMVAFLTISMISRLDMYYDLFDITKPKYLE